MTERRDPKAMACDEVKDRLVAYAQGELEAAQEELLARHLTECPDCAAHAALAERVELELAALPAFDAPPELIARIKNVARAAPAPVVSLAARRARRPSPWPRRLAAAAALVAGVTVGWWQLSRPAQPSAAEIAAAEREARYALALVARLGRRATAEVREEVLVERVAAPVMKSMSRQFGRGAVAKTGGQTS